MNTAIETYITSLFTTLPRTADLERARLELLEMSEDKYAELTAAGISENEATGRVITEFGNLDEVADALGIRAALEGAPEAPRVPEVGRDEAERALVANRRASLLTAGGILVILLALAAISAFLTEIANPWAAVVLFPSVAIAIGMFIASAFINKPASRIANGEVQLTRGAVAEYKVRREQESWRFATGLIVGITLLLLSLVVTVVLQNFGAGQIPGGGFLATIGLGVGVLVVTGMRRGMMGYLATSGEAPNPADVREEQNAMRVGLIAPIYWPLVVLVYLGWSFIGDAWEDSWIIWPLAGILFAVIVGGMYAASYWRDGADKLTK